MNQHILCCYIQLYVYAYTVNREIDTSILFLPLLSTGEFTTELIQISHIISLFIHLCLGEFKMGINQLQLKNGKNNMGQQ